MAWWTKVCAPLCYTVGASTSILVNLFRLYRDIRQVIISGEIARSVMIKWVCVYSLDLAFQRKANQFDCRLEHQIRTEASLQTIARREKTKRGRSVPKVHCLVGGKLFTVWFWNFSWTVKNLPYFSVWKARLKSMKIQINRQRGLCMNYIAAALTLKSQCL